MISDLFSKVKRSNQPLTTYHVALLNSKAYRALKNTATIALKKHNLTLPEWTILGSLIEKPDMHLVEIARLLNVKAPLVTNLITELENKMLINRVSDPVDPRAHMVKLTERGSMLVPAIEVELREIMKQNTKGISEKDILTYIKVLNVIVQNTNL